MNSRAQGIPLNPKKRKNTETKRRENIMKLFSLHAWRYIMHLRQMHNKIYKHNQSHNKPGSITPQAAHKPQKIDLAFTWLNTLKVGFK